MPVGSVRKIEANQVLEDFISHGTVAKFVFGLTTEFIDQLKE